LQCKKQCDFFCRIVYKFVVNLFVGATLAIKQMFQIESVCISLYGHFFLHFFGALHSLSTFTIREACVNSNQHSILTFFFLL